MRVRRGLRPFKGTKSETFQVLYDNKAPVVIPINAVAFGGRKFSLLLCFNPIFIQVVR
jgi:hypothetical protein